MKKLSLFLTIFGIFLSFSSPAWALKENEPCAKIISADGSSQKISLGECDKPFYCNAEKINGITTGYTCQKNTLENVIGQFEPPEAVKNLGPGAEGINNLINKVVQLIYALAGIIFVFMIIISGLQWILSGGEKEAVAKARGRLTWAIIGIVVLALAFVIMRVIGQITGFTFFEGQ
ncbi:MAG: pilin [Candidatus Daviesbacteria bacterium]|nr:pilin [Candidatus Daviesbacteria bacterium]